MSELTGSRPVTGRGADEPGPDFLAASARRMARQFLDRPSDGASAADVAARMCSVHAQVMPAAELSIGLRLAGATRTTTQEALWGDRSLIKTFGPRGTLHLLPAGDFPMWVGALSALPPVPNSHRKDVRFSPEQTEAVVEAIGTALADAELTPDEMNDAVVDLAGPWAGEMTMPAFQGMWPRWRQSMSDAARAGVLCFAPNRGRNVVYTNPRRWLPGFVPDPGASALDELVLGYLRAYGPASPGHLARWLAITPARATGLLDGLGDRVERIPFAGGEAHVAADDGDLSGDPPSGVRLLPYFDQFAVASAPREHLFAGRAWARALTPAGQAGNFPVLLVDGVVRGVWHHRRKGRRLEVTVEPIGTLRRAQLTELDEQVERVGSILEARPELTIGTVTVGGHA